MESRPKRRKYRDNPYTLDKVGNGEFLVSFKDGNNKLNAVKVTEEIFNTLNNFELKDISELNEFDRHIEHSEVFENNLNIRAMDKPISLEDDIIRKSSFENLKNAINSLPEIQKKD